MVLSRTPGYFRHGQCRRGHETVWSNTPCSTLPACPADARLPDARGVHSFFEACVARSQELGRAEASRGREFRGDTKRSGQSLLSSSGPLAYLAMRIVASQPSLLRSLFWLGCIPCRTPWSALDSDHTETTEQCPIPSMHSPSLRVSELVTATVPEIPRRRFEELPPQEDFSATQTVLRGQILARCTSDHGGNQVVFHSLFLKGMSVFERVVRRSAKVRDWILTFLLGHTIFLSTIRPETNWNDVGGFWNQLTDSNSIFVVAEFCFERFDFFVCRQEKREGRR